MTAHNIPIWRLMTILSKMMDEGFSIMDITITDDMEIMLRGIREIREKKDEGEDKDFNWEETI